LSEKDNISESNGQASMSMEAWLVSEGILTESQAELAGREATRLGLSFSEIVQRLGLVTSDQLAMYRSVRGQLRTAREFIASRPGQESHLSLRRLVLSDVLRERLSLELCQSTISVPIAERDGILWVACANPFDLPTLKRLEAAAGQKVEALPASETDIRLAINRNYRAHQDLYDAVAAIIKMDEAELQEQSSEDAPMIRLAEQILLHAATREASDVHLHAEERFLRIRLRVDGVLEEGLLLSGAIRKALTARFKILAGMDTAEDRLPQDGRIHFAIGSEDVDIRVSTLPCSNGESIVMRLLDQSRLKLDLTTLGFSEPQQAQLNEVLHQPYGVFLITGPTGSGKTTTLYSLLGMIDAEARSVFTLEDPIEYRMPLIRQTQVKDEIGLSFSAGLRTLLRQDPDVILVGETRDQVTAELMVRAALTGHLVFSTLHTNDALSAVPRLTDLGVPPYLLAGSLLGLSAQRLARRLCPVCREAKRIDASEWNALVGKDNFLAQNDSVDIFQASGCEACAQKGYSGRVSIAEIVRVDKSVRNWIEHGQSLSKMQEELQSRGVTFMRDDGLTSIEEIARVVQLEKGEAETNA
jgi:type II secretory ATPase GspE/PulE/Tfp pilus assembly ATPase PilB-like protein